MRNGTFPSAARSPVIKSQHYQIWKAPPAFDFRDDAAREHTEHECSGSSTFSRLAQYCVILEAEPQIGKTGVEFCR